MGGMDLNRFKQYCCALLMLALTLSAVSGAALSEERQEIDLMELIAPEEATVIEEAPAAQSEAGPSPSEGEASGEAAAPAEASQPAAEAAPPAEAAQPAAEAAAPAEEAPSVSEGETEQVAEPEVSAPAEAEVSAPAEAVEPAAEAVMAPEAAQPSAEAAAPAEAAQPAQTQPVTLNATELTLGKGETFALMPIVPSGAEALYFEYATSNKKVATVSEFGEISARKKGSATITVKVSDGTTLTCAVNVLKAPKSVKLNANDVALGLDPLTGSNTTFQLTAALSKGAGALIHYVSANSAVAEVSPTGLITPRSHGITTVTASTFNGKSATCTVAVLAGPEQMSFEEPSPVLCEREKRVLKLSATQGALAAARFTSSNPAVATVDADTGEVTAVAYGEATIVATSFNGKTASSALTVKPGPDSIALPASTITMGVGEELALGATPVRADGMPTSPALTYATSRKKTVAVSEDGALTALKKGTAKITVTAPNGVQAVCTVKVVKPPKTIRLSIGKATLAYDAAAGVAEQTKLTVTLSKGTGSSVTYSDYDPAVVSVARDGTVTATGLGSTVITATTFNGLTTGCAVTVTAPGGGNNAGGKVVNVAHRGGAGYWPENTLEAFKNAASTGATAIELDVRTTKDGVQVVHHDSGFTVGKKKYRIRKLTLAKLRELKPDVCTLDEALEVVAASGLELNLELKDTATPKACVESVRSHGLQDRTVYISFKTDLLSQVRKLEPGARLGLCFTNPSSKLDDYIYTLKPIGLFQNATKLTVDNINQWHAKGLLVGVWTVDDAAEIRTWLGMGVDYITSNYPKRVAEALAAR